MSTTAIVIIIVAVVLLALLAMMLLSGKRREERRLRKQRQEAAEHHRAEAQARDERAALAEQRADEARLEADRVAQEARMERERAKLHSNRAELHDKGLADDELGRDGGDGSGMRDDDRTTADQRATRDDRGAFAAGGDREMTEEERARMSRTDGSGSGEPAEVREVADDGTERRFVREDRVADQEVPSGETGRTPPPRA
jgi:septal ring factor EnvC (AmiA/AmiB activator)